MKKQQSGFTLIELVIVIVILGLLAATALPRFADLTGDARRAALSGIEGAVRSASAIVHAQALVNGTTTGASSVMLEGINVLLTEGYPTNAGIDAATDITGATFDGAGTFTIDAGCSVQYVQPAGAGLAPTFNIAGDTGNGCD